MSWLEEISFMEFPVEVIIYSSVSGFFEDYLFFTSIAIFNQDFACLEKFFWSVIVFGVFAKLVHMLSILTCQFVPPYADHNLYMSHKSA